MLQGEATSYRLGVPGVALTAFAAVMLPRALLNVSPAMSGTALAITQAALFLGCLVAAYLWRHDPQRAPRIGGHGTAAGALFVVLSVAALIALPEEVAPGSDFGALGLLVLASAAAGMAIGSVIFANRSRCGLITAAYVVGAASGIALPPADTAAVTAVAASAGGVLLAAAHRRSTPLLVSAVGLAFGIASLVAPALEISLPLLDDHTGPWTISAVTIESAGTFTLWSAAALILLLPIALLARQPREERSGPARLHAMVILWSAGVSILFWRAMFGAAGEVLAAWQGATLAAFVAGAVIGGLAVDASAILIIAARRTFFLGSLGVAGLVALEALSARSGGPGPGQLWSVLGLLGLTGLLTIPAATAMARAGGLLGAQHAVWLWACAGATGASSFVLISRASPAAMAAPRTLGLGIGLALLATLPAHNIFGLRGALARTMQWFGAEWGGTERFATPLRLRLRRYSPWMMALQAITYLGYAPWWVLSCALRLVWTLAGAFVKTLIELMGGLRRSLDRVLPGRPKEAPGQTIDIRYGAPLVELSPIQERRLPQAKDVQDTRPHGAVAVVDLLSLPILALTYLLDQLAKALGLAIKQFGRGESELEGRETVSVEEARPETVMLEPPPDVVPGSATSDQELLAKSMPRRSQDHTWRRWLRVTFGFLLGTAVREWLAADIARPWDDRVFRAEIIGPRGRRFELLGYLWESPKRCGCVVTVPTLPGNVEKAVEVYSRHPEARPLLDSEPERLQKVLLRAGFRTAIADLNSGSMGNRTVACASPRIDLLEPHQDRQCDVRQELPDGGYRCRQPMPQDGTRGATNPSACESCGFPEIWQRCSSLKLEGTVGFFDHEGTLHRRAHSVCRLTGSPADVENCLRLECFSPSTITRIIATQPGRTR